MGQKFEIFRVEDKSGHGPYRNPNQTWRWWITVNKHLKSKGVDNVPPPGFDIPIWNDLTEDEQNLYSFGFQSLNYLNDWFDNILSDLFNEGYFIVKYEVDKDDILFGTKQVAFRKPTK